ncbi:hypothetical protein ACVMYR_31160 [Micromonospora sp. PTRAS2]
MNGPSIGLGDIIDVFDEDSDDYVDDGSYDGPEQAANYGQAVAGGIVNGGMHQTIYNEVKLLNRLISAHQLTPTYVAQVMATFVERSFHRPGHEGRLSRSDVERLLTNEPCVVLVGAARTGLTTVAVALLDGFGRAGWRLQRILFDGEDGRPFAGTDLPKERGVVQLLRLPREASRVDPQFAGVLHAHAADLRSLGSHLVITATTAVWQAIGGQVGIPVIEVAPPDPIELVRRRCAAAEVDVEAVVTQPMIGRLLDRASAADAARLADIVVSAMRNHPDKHGEELAKEVSGAYGDWDDELASWFADASWDLRARLFLVAAAMLEGELAADILDTVNALGRHLGDLEVSRLDGLANAGLRALAAAVGAEIVDGRLWFVRANYAEAALTFVHADRSSVFRRKLWEWATTLASQRNGRSSSVTAARVTEMMVRLVLRRRDVRPLTQLRHWVSRPHLRDHIVNALTATAVSDEVGVEVRALLYRWARDLTDARLLTVVAEVCAGQMADLYPKVSLTRLGHLCTRQYPAVTEAVVVAVIRLWERQELRQRVLQVITLWATDGSGPRAEAAWRIFSALSPLEAHPLLHADDVPEQREALVRAAARLIDAPDSADIRAAFVTTTLEAAVGSGSDAERFIQFFADTVRWDCAGTSRMVRICKLAFTWQPVRDDHDQPVRRELRDRLVEALHRADPLTARS